jgi:chromate transporter
MVAVTNLIPGSNSTEVMIHIGYVTRGIPGAILAGICFVAPAFLLTLALAVLYVNSGTIPQENALLWGIKPVIVAIIAHVGYRFAVTVLKTRALWLLCGVSLALMVLLDVTEMVVMLGIGLAYALYRVRPQLSQSAFILLPIMAPLLENTQQIVQRAGVWDLFFYFLRIGSVLFGSGYLLVAYIQQDLVNTFAWLSAREVLDAVAIGQTTPGPVLTTVTVVGYIVAGLPGAIMATIGVFLPAFVLVILTAPLLPRVRESRFCSAFLAGANTGVIAALLVTLVDLALAAWRTSSDTALSLTSLFITIGALALLLRTTLNPIWLIAVGGLIGLLLVFLGVSV